MGIFAFLTTSRLKTELTRQRDEIARLHQSLDLETTQKLEAEKTAQTHEKKQKDLEKKGRELEQKTKGQEEKLQKKTGQIKRRSRRPTPKDSARGRATSPRYGSAPLYPAPGNRRKTAPAQ